MTHMTPPLLVRPLKNKNQKNYFRNFFKNTSPIARKMKLGSAVGNISLHMYTKFGDIRSNRSVTKKIKSILDIFWNFFWPTYTHRGTTIFCPDTTLNL